MSRSGHVRPDSAKRLMDALVVASARTGAARLTVKAVLDEAGVSRATFYQYFSSIEDCYSATYRRCADHLARDFAAELGRRDVKAAALALKLLVDWGASQPDVARLLTLDVMTAGPCLLAERDALVARIARIASGQHDTPTWATLLLGTVMRLLAIELAGGGISIRCGEDLVNWAHVFKASTDEGRWCRVLSRSAATSQRPPKLKLKDTPRRAPASTRERIVRGAAESVYAKGYPETTVADIVALATVSRRRFYNEFADKADAVEAACEFIFKKLLAACAPAFFVPGPWPERVWRSSLAFAAFFAAEPSFAHLGFVEPYAPGQHFIVRAHEMHLALTPLLEEGYRQVPEAQALPRSYSMTTAAALMELGYAAARTGRAHALRELQPLAAQIALAPFVGPRAARAFVLSKTRRAVPDVGSYPRDDRANGGAVP